MKPSTFQDGVRLQFDCLVKRVIDTTVKDYQKELGRRAKHEITFSDVSEKLKRKAFLLSFAIILAYRPPKTA